MRRTSRRICCPDRRCHRCKRRSQVQDHFPCQKQVRCFFLAVCVPQASETLSEVLNKHSERMEEHRRHLSCLSRSCHWRHRCRPRQAHAAPAVPTVQDVRLLPDPNLCFPPRGGRRGWIPDQGLDCLAGWVGMGVVGCGETVAERRQAFAVNETFEPGDRRSCTWKHRRSPLKSFNQCAWLLLGAALEMMLAVCCPVALVQAAAWGRRSCCRCAPTSRCRRTTRDSCAGPQPLSRWVGGWGSGGGHTFKHRS